MRIGINALYLIPGKTGGMYAYLKNYLKYLQEIDTENEYFIYTGTEGAGTLNLFAENFHEIRCPLPARMRTLHYLWEIFIMPLQMWKDKIHLLHSPANISPPWLPCKSVVTIHDVRAYFFSPEFPRSFTFIYRKLLPIMAKRSAKVITVSEYSKKTITDVLGLSPDKIAVIPLAPETAPVQEKAKEIIKAKYNIENYIFTLITAVPHKNMDGLIHAYKILTERKQDIPQLVIAGITGPDLKITKNRLKKWGLDQRVVFTGFVEDAYLPALYTSARLFVFPSKYEGFGLPILEAMSYGIPVVSSGTTALPEVVGDAGIMCDPDNPLKMADAIENVLSDDTLRKALIQKGLIRAAGFSWRQTAEKTLEEYKTAVTS